VLDALRAADLVALPDSDKLLIAPTNTKTADARLVEERLRVAVPNATAGVAPYRWGDTADDLLSVPNKPPPRGRGEHRSYLKSPTDNRAEQ
jgi:hypothetical protein